MANSDQDMFAMEDVDHEFDDRHPHHSHSLSRLSMCNTTIMPPHKLDANDQEDDDYYGSSGGDGGSAMTMYMSRLSFESFDRDADEEFSDEKEGQHMLGGLSSDSDKDQLKMADCYSLAAGDATTRAKEESAYGAGIFKEYRSENEVAQKGLLRKKTSRRYRLNRRWMATRERWAERSTNFYNSANCANAIAMESSAISCPNNTSISTNNNFSCSGERDQGAGLLVITRPKGGSRSLCMDMEELKACHDLGFELEHECMLCMPSGISLSVSTLENSSGRNSPIASWRISSPGDDPRDVKARLKVWAQTVAALASTSRYSA